jgi:hypothetical protein
LKESEADFESLVMLYGEDPKMTTPEDFFGIFASFRSAFMNAQLENEMAAAKAIEQEKKEAEKRNMEERRKKKREGVAMGGRMDFSGSNGAGGTGSGAQNAIGQSAGGNGGLDDLISAIKSGKAFNSDFSSGRKRNTSNGDKDNRRGRG